MDNRKISIQEVENFVRWFMVNAPGVSKHGVLTLVGLEKIFTVAQIRGQKYLSAQVSYRLIKVCAHFKYDFDEQKKRRIKI